MRCGTYFRDLVLTQRQMATRSRGIETGLILQMVKFAIIGICGRAPSFRDLKMAQNSFQHFPRRTF